MYVFILLFNHLKQQKINNNDSVPLNVPLSHDSEPSYTIDDLWNAAKCDFPAVACQNVCMKPPVNPRAVLTQSFLIIIIKKAFHKASKCSADFKFGQNCHQDCVLLKQ